MRTRTLAAPLGLLVAGALLTGCSLPYSQAQPAAQEGEVTIRYQGTANAVTLPELADDLGYLEGINLTWISNVTGGPQSIQAVATNQSDTGGAFTGAVVKLVDAGAPVKAVINYYGSDDTTFAGYYVPEDSPIRTPRDLIGAKVAVNTLGAHHEAAVTTWLRQGGLTESEIAQVQLVVVPPNDTEQAIRRGQVEVGTLSGVLQDKAVAEGGLRRLFADTDLFGDFNAGQLVLREDFIAQHPEATRTYVTGVAKAIEWLRETPREEVIARYERIITERGRNESTDAVQYWKSVGVTRAGVIRDEDISRWEPWLESSGIIDTGGLTPGDYYTNEYNDLAEETP